MKGRPVAGAPCPSDGGRKSDDGTQGARLGTVRAWAPVPSAPPETARPETPPVREPPPRDAATAGGLSAHSHRAGRIRVRNENLNRCGPPLLLLVVAPTGMEGPG